MSVTASSYDGTVKLAKPFMDKNDHTLFPATDAVSDPSELEGRTLVPMVAVLADNADNTTAIATAATVCTGGQTLAVKLQGRTLYKDGNWNTLCLPFKVGDVTAAEGHHFDGTPLEGAIVKELDTSESNLAANGTLTLSFTNATSIEAGKPYIVKWTTTGDNIVNPVFTGVAVDATAPTAVTFTNNANAGGACQFVGQYSPFAITADNKDEIIMLGSGSTLGYSKNPRQLKCFRAHFYVPTNGGGQLARSFVLDFGEGEQTGIIAVANSSLFTLHSSLSGWYTLDGRKLDGKPTKKGMYIVNGKKIVIK
jgi:hypothetical protein